MKWVKMVVFRKILVALLWLVIIITTLSGLFMTIRYFYQEFTGEDLLATVKGESSAGSEVAFPITVVQPGEVTPLPTPTDVQLTYQIPKPTPVPVYSDLGIAVGSWMHNMVSWSKVYDDVQGQHPGEVDKIMNMPPDEWAKEQSSLPGTNSFAAILEAMTKTDDTNSSTRESAWANVMAQAQALLAIDPSLARVTATGEEGGDNLVAFLQKLQAKVANWNYGVTSVASSGSSSGSSSSGNMIIVDDYNPGSSGSVVVSSGSSGSSSAPAATPTPTPALDVAAEAAKLAEEEAAQAELVERYKDVAYFGLNGDRYLVAVDVEMEVSRYLWNRYPDLTDTEHQKCRDEAIAVIKTRKIGFKYDKPIYNMAGFDVKASACVAQFAPAPTSTPVPRTSTAASSNNTGSSSGTGSQTSKPPPQPTPRPTPTPDRSWGSISIDGIIYGVEGLGYLIEDYLDKNYSLDNSQKGTVISHTLWVCENNRKLIVIGNMLVPDCSDWKAIAKAAVP